MERAQQEKMRNLIRADQTMCPRGQGRSYHGKLEIPRGVLTTQDLLATTEGKEKVVKSGWVDKRGSGVGLFATNRWKPKFLILTPGLLMYFDSNKVSSTNQASRLIVIDGSSSVGRLAGGSDVHDDSGDDYNNNDSRALVCFQSSNREYVFGFSSEEEADEWVQVLQKQCDVAESREEPAIKQTSHVQQATNNNSSIINATSSVVSPSSVSSLCVGYYQFCQQDRSVTAILGQ